MWVFLSVIAGVYLEANNEAPPVGAAAPAQTVATTEAPAASSNVVINGGQAGASPNVIINGQAAGTTVPAAPTGRFNTVEEVKPILNMTRGSWIAVREFNGKDLIYVTQIWSWRCGLSEMHIQINGGGFANWPLPECHEQYAQPNVILDEDGLPYATRGLKTVQTVDIRLVFKDDTTDTQAFERRNVLIP